MLAIRRLRIAIDWYKLIANRYCMPGIPTSCRISYLGCGVRSPGHSKRGRVWLYVSRMDSRYSSISTSVIFWPSMNVPTLSVAGSDSGLDPKLHVGSEELVSEAGVVVDVAVEYVDVIVELVLRSSGDSGMWEFESRRNTSPDFWVLAKYCIARGAAL